jgi:hypothetical protein
MRDSESAQAVGGIAVQSSSLQVSRSSFRRRWRLRPPPEISFSHDFSRAVAIYIRRLGAEQAYVSFLGGQRSRLLQSPYLLLHLHDRAIKLLKRSGALQLVFGLALLVNTLP